MHNILSVLMGISALKTFLEILKTPGEIDENTFQYFLKRVSALQVPLTATEYYAYNSVPSVENIKLMTIIFGKMGQNVRRSKCAAFYQSICFIRTLIKL